MKVLMQKAENYFLAEQQKNMPEVDKHLLFVIDEKQNTIDLTDRGIDFLSSSAGNPEYYVLPDIGVQLAELEKQELSATEKAAQKSEIMRNYAIQSDRVHTLNQLLKAYTLFERDVEYIVVDNEVKIVDEQTGRIMEGRRYSDGLHQALEAKENVKVEAATQTYATITLQNYFRMYSKLAGMTGTAETEAGEFWSIYKLEVVSIPTNKPVIREDRNDLVYKTKREKYAAVIDEIVALTQAGRPVLVGTTSVEVSELLSRMLTGRKIKHNVLNAKLHKKEADIVAQAGLSGAVTIATNMAGRGTDIKLSPESREAGGLAIIGTERHESRRVDRQLRGRSGRQGDPGSSQFFVSLEDNLMRLFASQRIASIMDRMGYKEGDVIQHGMVTRSIERAQKKVEENHFGMRKRLLEYDDVMNTQREAVYKKRRHALFGERLSIDIANMMYDTIENYYGDFRANRDFGAFNDSLIRTFGIESSLSEDKLLEGKSEDIIETLYKSVEASYKQKNDNIVKEAYPIIKNVYEVNGGRFENIMLPISDGKKTLNILANIQKVLKSSGKEITLSIQKGLSLAVIDDAWKEHLREMDDLKQNVQNASYEQKDPLLIYKFEAFELFKTLMIDINKDVSTFLSLGSLPRQEQGGGVREGRQERTDMSRMQAGRDNSLGGIEDPSARRGAGEHLQTNAGGAPQKPQPVHVEKKVGRNDPCPCGSGKKYKNCHGANA